MVLTMLMFQSHKVFSVLHGEHPSKKIANIKKNLDCQKCKYSQMQILCGRNEIGQYSQKPQFRHKINKNSHNQFLSECMFILHYLNHTFDYLTFRS